MRGQRWGCKEAIKHALALVICAARSFATSLLFFPFAGTANVEEDSPLLSDFFEDSTAFPQFASRMP